MDHRKTDIRKVADKSPQIFLSLGTKHLDKPTFQKKILLTYKKLENLKSTLCRYWTPGIWFFSFFFSDSSPLLIPSKVWCLSHLACFEANACRSSNEFWRVSARCTQPARAALSTVCRSRRRMWAWLPRWQAPWQKKVTAFLLSLASIWNKS